jgi:DNA-binding response OmpR family regulator
LKILVVDDDPLIGEIVARYLTKDHHFAEVECEPQAALDHLSAEHFDLLITDQDMPDMTGGELAVASKKISPTTRVMLLTGFGAHERPAEGASAIDLVVGKPIVSEALQRAVATCSTPITQKRKR